MKIFKKLIIPAILLVFIGIAIYLIKFNPRFYITTLNSDILNESLESGKAFMLNNQKEEGNFNYAYDFVNKTFDDNDSQVRQAGALWGVSLLHKHHPTPQTRDALEKGFSFFEKYSVFDTITKNRRYITYPDQYIGKTGTVALVCLAYIEFLQTIQHDPGLYQHDSLFNQYFRFLLSLRNNNGLFSKTYNIQNGERTITGSSPYFDGESLLVMAKAARYLGAKQLKQQIIASADSMYREYVEQARQEEKDSPVTKGFYQWGSMAFSEIYHMGWGSRYAERIIELAYWMIDTHHTLWRRKNTAYAQEGIITAYEIARLENNEKAACKFKMVIDRGLKKLTRWQVVGPIPNAFLKRNNTNDPLAKGGIMNCRNCPYLRIDVTQHQIHAVILGLKYVYGESE